MVVFIKVCGWLLIAMAAADIFLTVLFPRSGAGVLSPYIGKGGWALFRFLSRFVGPYRRLFLALSGPTLIVIIASTWSLLLAFGFALIYWPELGTALQKSLGSTPTDFLTALYFSGFSLSTLGIGDIVPSATHTRILTVVEAGMGFSFFTITITYILSVYSALQRRNTLASILEHKTGGSGNSLYLVADLAAVSNPHRSDYDLQDLACRTADVLESHKFYPILYYFHFLQERYALPRMVLVLMDTATLMRTLPTPGKENLRPSITQLTTAGHNLFEHLAETFHPKHPSHGYSPSDEMVEQWRAHFRSTVQEVESRGVGMTAEMRKKEEEYIALRRHWHPHFAAFAAALGYRMEEVLPKDCH